MEDLAVSYISATSKTPILYTSKICDWEDLEVSGDRRYESWNVKNGSTVHHIGTGSETGTLFNNIYI